MRRLQVLRNLRGSTSSRRSIRPIPSNLSDYQRRVSGHPRLSSRTVAPRREDPHDLRRHQRDPAVSDRQSNQRPTRRLEHCGDLTGSSSVRWSCQMSWVAHAPRRIAEAARMGFTRAIVPTNSANGVEGIPLCRVATVTDAILAVGLGGVESGANRHGSAAHPDHQQHARRASRH